MKCLYCDKEFEQTYHWRNDYCSIECITASKSPCPTCGAKIVKRTNEKIGRFIKRTFCNIKCSGKVNSERIRTPETLEKQRQARKEFEQTAKGKEARRRTIKGWKEWRKNNPDAVKNTTERQHQSRLKRGVYKETSKRLKSFFQTPEGEARKEKYRQCYTGVKRHPRVTQKMKDGLRKHWDSPEGIALREAISKERTQGLSNVPYGPGWTHQRSKIRKRDGHACVVCGISRAEYKRALDVHHIHNRRKFGYIPGQNLNYRWANHPANLITVCQSCHQKIEMGSLDVPQKYQQQADTLWAEFIK